MSCWSGGGLMLDKKKPHRVTLAGFLYCRPLKGPDKLPGNYPDCVASTPISGNSLI
jgi:hypothetical protein